MAFFRPTHSKPLVGTCILLAAMFVALGGCAQGQVANTGSKSDRARILAVETFLGDIARNVAGEEATVESLLPIGIDPHGFEPTPSDMSRLSSSSVLILNGAGFEQWLEQMIQNGSLSGKTLIRAADGLKPRHDEDEHEESAGHDKHGHESDPHFWLDPISVVTYVDNIRIGLSNADPARGATYQANAEAYTAELRALDAWIREQVETIPESHRLLVTNHESFGYFADRYGFRIIGTVLPSVGTGASPSAQQMAELVDLIRESGARAIFVETGSNPQLAKQISEAAGVKLVTGLFTHSVSEPSGSAPTYIDMIKFNVSTIVAGLADPS